MELKPSIAEIDLDAAECSNCTFMELKPCIGSIFTFV